MQLYLELQFIPSLGQFCFQLGCFKLRFLSSVLKSVFLFALNSIFYYVDVIKRKHIIYVAISINFYWKAKKCNWEKANNLMIKITANITEISVLQRFRPYVGAIIIVELHSE